MSELQLTQPIPTLTDEYAAAWKAMGISQGWQIMRLTDWANMLEKRLAELDPAYRSYSFGKKTTCA